MNKTMTIIEIDNMLADLTDLIYPCLNKLRTSEYIYVSRIDQQIDQINSVVGSLEKTVNGTVCR